MSKEMIHACDSLKAAIPAMPGNPAGGYSYKWTAGKGWVLYLGEGEVENYTWQIRCEWCSQNLPIHDDYVADRNTEHRCPRLVHREWGNLRRGTDSFLLVYWDGYEWCYSDDGVLLQNHLCQCPVCEEMLPDPRSLARANKVEII